jgi:hypothetical protein
MNTKDNSVIPSGEGRVGRTLSTFDKEMLDPDFKAQFEADDKRRTVSHTAGPWTVITGQYPVGTISINKSVSERICTIQWGEAEHAKEAEANAALIAAAPELLEALKKAQRALTMAATESFRSEIQIYLSGGYAEMIQGAACGADTLGIDAAIRKATGGATR